MADRVYNFSGDKYKQPILEVLQPHNYSGPEESTLAQNITGDAQIRSAVSKPYEAAGYEDKYGGRVDELLNSLSNRGQFSYNPENDPAYQAYRKQYLREGKRATQDTMAQAAAMTGGRPSSYAATAAAQQGDYYAAQLSDKVPQLYEQAYNRYIQDFQKDAQMAQIYQNQQQNDYNRFNQDRAFGYQTNQDWINNMMNNRQQVYNMESQDRAFNYQQKQDWIRNMQTQEQQEWNNFIQQAQMAYNVGDYKQLEAMGFDTSRANFGNDLTIAQLIAQYTGDTSNLRALMKR